MALQGLTLRAVPTADHSQLLNLPKELRLEIWKYTVTDPSTHDLVVHIDTDFVPCSPQENQPGKRPYDPLRQYSRFERTFKTSFSKPRNQPVNVAILQSNRLIYEEALPFLYHPVKFYPSNAAFTSFLSSLSDFAKIQIRYVRLNINLPRLETVELSWSVTCAQVARLPGIQGIEIENGRAHQPRPHNIRKKLVGPLLKIRAPKKLIPDGDEEFQELLLDAAERHKARKEAVKAQGLLQEMDSLQCHETLDATAGIASDKPHEYPVPEALKRAIAANLHTEDDSAPIEDMEVSEWDMVSVHSSSSFISLSQSELVVGTKRSCPLLADEPPPLLSCDDWEIVEPSSLDDGHGLWTKR